ncbi:flagellar motor protein MotB [Sphingomonas sp.]|jgi:chemotaxis protein MotB|uniref:flagellar motor protein MotB n=1 Tax=Sphingomonas sp. TaxID=28214 RepID=UPI002EDA9834
MAAANTRPIIVVRKIKKIAGGHHGGAWKVAYADFVTAMMAFFMLLWLISNPDKQRLKGLAEYFSPSSLGLSQTNDQASSAAGVSGMPGAGGHGRRAQSTAASTPTGQPSTIAASAGTARGGTADVPDASLRVLAQEMRVAIDSLPPDENGSRAMRVEESREGLRISLMDTAARSMFSGGTAQLNPFAREMLARVANKLAKSDALIAIEGHTDGDGRGTGDANWRLSSERAIAARAAMIAAGMAPGRFSEIVAMADTRPVYPDQPDRPENRRITIVATGAAPALPTDASFRF